MQVPSEPLQNSQSIYFMPLRLGIMAKQLSKVQVASIVTMSPAQALHVHVISPFEFATAVAMHGGHSFVAAQQPLLPGLEPSAHVAAEGVGSDGGPDTTPPEGGGDKDTAGAGPAHVALSLTGHCVPEVARRVTVCAGKLVGANRLAPEVTVFPHVPVLQL